jgi:hypothetical protein
MKIIIDIKMSLLFGGFAFRFFNKSHSINCNALIILNKEIVRHVVTGNEDKSERYKRFCRRMKFEYNGEKIR